LPLVTLNLRIHRNASFTPHYPPISRQSVI